MLLGIIVRRRWRDEFEKRLYDREAVEDVGQRPLTKAANNDGNPEMRFAARNPGSD